MTQQRSISLLTLMTIGIIGILILRPSVISQPINISNILSNNLELIGYLPIALVCFLWGASTTFLRKR